MKNVLCATLFLIPFLSFAQRLEKSEVDRFTHQKIKETDWNKLIYGLKYDCAIRVMARSADADVVLHFKIAGHKIMSVLEGDYVLLLLDDERSIILKIAGYDMSKLSRGYRDIGNMELLDFPVMPLSHEDITALQNHSVKAIRIYLGGRDKLEYDVPDKHQLVISNCINLVL